MLSRVANAIYWMSRYFERAENIARFVDVNLHLTLDLAIEERAQWDPLVTVTGDHDIFTSRYGEASQENVIQFLTFDQESPNSIISCLRAARENARTVREVISSEMWEQVNQFYRMINQSSAPREAASRPHEFFEKIKMNSHLSAGLREGTMSHGEAYHFLRMGRLIERADKTSRLLDVKYFIVLPDIEYVGTPYDNLHWAALLKSASAFEMYRKRFHRITPKGIVDFLLFDREFPRSIRYCVATMGSSMHAITGSAPGTFANTADRRLGRLSSELSYSDVEEVMEGGLHEYLDGLQVKLNDVGNAIFETFFAVRLKSGGPLQEMNT